MLDYTKFHDVFPADLQIPYDRRLQHEIEDHRKNLGGTLFIDRVSKALGISKGTSWICDRATQSRADMESKPILPRPTMRSDSCISRFAKPECRCTTSSLSSTTSCSTLT